MTSEEENQFYNFYKNSTQKSYLLLSIYIIGALGAFWNVSGSFGIYLNGHFVVIFWCDWLEPLEHKQTACRKPENHHLLYVRSVNQITCFATLHLLHPWPQRPEIPFRHLSRTSPFARLSFTVSGSWTRRGIPMRTDPPSPSPGMNRPPSPMELEAHEEDRVEEVDEILPEIIGPAKSCTSTRRTWAN